MADVLDAGVSERYSNNRGEAEISQRHLDLDTYNFTSGIALIINNKEFDRRLNLPDRTGSDVDASSLMQRFIELGFDSDLLNDVTAKEIREKFDEIKKILQNIDCLIVTFLTHGDGDKVYATDEALKIDDTMAFFNAENCPELHLKPKIFIFQTSRGSELGHGMPCKLIRDQNQSDSSVDYSEYNQTYGETIRIPNEADFLAVYSTTLGHKSFISTEKGSPFVRYLSDELLRMETGENFYKVLTRINKRVGFEYKPNVPDTENVTQMPCFISHLTKNLVLKQK